MRNQEETEIKIEYFESFDVDPLREITQGNISEDLPTANSKDINRDAEIDSKWYKQLDNAGKYICRFCELSYVTVQTVRNHVKMKHNAKYQELKSKILSLRKRKLKCHICKAKHKYITDLQEHVHIHGVNNIKKSCIKCQAVFKNEADMLTHMANEHRILKNKLHFCTICGYSTPKLSHLKQHKNTHTHSNKKKCSHCSYSTNNKSNLKVHEQTHTEEKPYICEYEGCNYRCATKPGLYSHQFKHNKHINMLYCDKCSYSTVYKNSLMKHVDSHLRDRVRKMF